MDSRVTAPLLQKLQAAGMTEYRLLMLSDHKTLMATRGHDGDPVPYLLYDSRRDSGFGGVYDEPTGMAGRSVAAGTALMDMLFERE